MSPDRPLGVTAIGALLVVAPFVGALGLLAIAVPGTPLDVLWKVNPSGAAAFHRYPALVGVVVCVLPVAVAAGVGLLRMRRWGRLLAMALLAVNALGDAIAIAAEGARGVVGVLIAVALLVYLSRPRIRRAFGEEAGREAYL